LSKVDTFSTDDSDNALDDEEHVLGGLSEANNELALGNEPELELLHDRRHSALVLFLVEENVPLFDDILEDQGPHILLQGFGEVLNDRLLTDSLEVPPEDIIQVLDSLLQRLRDLVLVTPVHHFVNFYRVLGLAVVQR